MMFPVQIRKAIQESWPVVIPVGVMEYHAEHLAVGTDTLVITKAVELLEAEMDMVVFPALCYGAASYAVEAPEGRGTVQINPKAIYFFARDFFMSLLRIGFRNIHLFVFHQSGNFAAGMPTDLALKLAAREMIFTFLEKSRGEGWWAAIQTVGVEGARLAGGSSGETRGIGRGSGGVLRRVAAVS
jgi:creatinine amidohydrolase